MPASTISSSRAGLSGDHGLRTLYGLLPRHALFRVRATIHGVSNVPLVYGSFKLRWKFRNAFDQHRHHHHHHVTRAGKISPNGKGKEKEIVLLEGENADTQSISASSSSSGPSDAFAQSEARGSTAFMPLRDHAVKWESELDVTVQMTVSRRTDMLEPSLLKLIVIQDVGEEGDAPIEPKLGYVEINLAEYVGEGKVTRNHLLLNSRTNASVKVTLDVTFISGDENYKKPLLPKPRLHEGINALIANDHFRLYPSRANLASPGTTSPLPSPRPKINRTSSSYQFNSYDTMLLPAAMRQTEQLIEDLFNPRPTLSRSNTSVSRSSSYNASPSHNASPWLEVGDPIATPMPLVEATRPSKPFPDLTVSITSAETGTTESMSPVPRFSIDSGTPSESSHSSLPSVNGSKVQINEPQESRGRAKWWNWRPGASRSMTPQRRQTTSDLEISTRHSASSRSSSLARPSIDDANPLRPSLRVET